MGLDLEALGINDLSVEDRIELAYAIWDTIPPEKSIFRLSAKQAQELDKRIAEDDAAPDDVVPWEEVEAEILARHTKPGDGWSFVESRK